MSNSMHERDVQLNALIQQMAEQHQPELPSAGVIWWRAQVLRKMEETKRVERPMTIMRFLAGSVALLVPVYLLVTFRGDLAGRISSFGSLIPVCLLAFGILVIYLFASIREARS